MGQDGRLRCLLSPYGTLTGRNMPSPKEFIFGQTKWARHMIQPPSGYGLAYGDYSQQEFAIAAILGGDMDMLHVYESTDPYIAWGQRAGLIPEGATKSTHPVQRAVCKTIVLGQQYGQTEFGLHAKLRELGNRLGDRELMRYTVRDARELVDVSRRAFPVYWRWIESITNGGQLTGKLETPMGWRYYFTAENKKGEANVRTLQNWPMQSYGADILRLLCIRLVEAGLEPIAPVHDAVMIQYRLKDAADAVSRFREVMQAASAEILKGYRLKVDVNTFDYPAHFTDENGAEMWAEIKGYLDQIP